MCHKIAVLMDENQQMTSLEQCRRALLYLETGGVWKPYQEIRWQLGAAPDIAEIRNDIRELIEQLEDCRIIVSSKLNGVPFHIFNKMGFHIFETGSSASQNLFQEIMQEIKSASEEAETSGSVAQVPFSPQNDGIYYFNLIKVQQAFPAITSKQALKHFMEEVLFIKFELICDHMPPWLENLADVKNYDWSVEQLDEHSCRVVISNVSSDN